MNTIKDPDVYQKEAIRTSSHELRHIWEENEIDGCLLLNGVLGLSGESGEVVDLVKKYVFQGHDLDVSEVKKEVGDVLWYLANICEAIHCDMSEVMTQNIEKLQHRYPNGFDKDRSVNRDIYEGEVPMCNTEYK